MQIKLIRRKQRIGINRLVKLQSGYVYGLFACRGRGGESILRSVLLINNEKEGKNKKGGAAENRDDGFAFINNGPNVGT